MISFRTELVFRQSQNDPYIILSILQIIQSSQPEALLHKKPAHAKSICEKSWPLKPNFSSNGHKTQLKHNINQGHYNIFVVAHVHKNTP